MSEGRLAGRVVLITGGGRGMGRAMALGCARARARAVVVTSAASPGETRAVAQAIEQTNGAGSALALTADVGDAEACERAVAATMERYGAIDALINNAGKGMKGVRRGRDPFWKNDVAGWHALVATNINGPFLMARAAAPHMVAAGFGRIVNISKSADSMHGPMNTPYGPSKAAVEAMTLSWALDLLDTGVTVNTLLPGGLTDTTFSRPSAIPKAREQGKRVYAPEEIVPAAVWLASDGSAAYTGCRFNGSKWDEALPDEDAAEGARVAPIFPAPKRQSPLARAWVAPRVKA